MIRATIFAVTLVLSQPALSGIASMGSDEQAIAGAAIAQTLVRKTDKLFMIANTTATFSCAPDHNRVIRTADGCSGMRARGESPEQVFVWLQTAMPEVSSETLSDFRLKSEFTSRLEVTFPVPVKQILWNPSGARDSPTEAGTPDLLISVSRVGLDKAHTQALLYIGVAAWTGSERAGGEYVLLKRRSGSWFVAGRVRKWDMGPK